MENRHKQQNITFFCGLPKIDHEIINEQFSWILGIWISPLYIIRPSQSGQGSRRVSSTFISQAVAQKGWVLSCKRT